MTAYIGKRLMFTITLMLCLISVRSNAVTVSQIPLFLGISAEPKIMFVLDDSGSMRFEIMPDDIILDSNNIGSAYFMYPRQTNVYGSSSDYDNSVIIFDGTNTTYNVSAYFRSPNINKLYYNPTITYVPWSKSDGTLYANATPNCALHNPERIAVSTPGASGVTAYCRNLTANNTENAYYYTDFSSNYTSSSKTFWPAVYYAYKGSGDVKSKLNYTKIEIKSGQVYTGGVNRNDCLNKPTCTYQEEIQNFANWYTYYRSRVLSARAGIGKAFARQGTNMRVGFTTINTSDTTINTVKSFSGSNRVSFFSSLYGSQIPAQGTPLRRSLDDVGQYFSGSSNSGPWSATPGTSSTTAHLTCRQCYTILTTDGYWNGDQASTAGARANVDNSTGSLISGPNNQAYKYQPISPYKDSDNNTLSDVAMYYWNRDLRTDLANKVPTNLHDPAFWQHMVTFTVGLGVEGTLKQSDYPALVAGTLSWPNQVETTTDARRIDDLWHAAVNGHGGFYSAADPTSFADALSDSLAKIAERTSSASAVATNSSKMSTNTQLFQGRFNSADWTGQLQAFRIDANGAIQAAQWDASAKIPPFSARKIFTYKAGTGGVNFIWSDLDTTQQQALNLPLNSSVSDGNGSLRLDYLRGDQSKELLNGGQFRNRNSLLGDIINSNPLFVGAQDYGYALGSSGLSSAEKSSYLSFRNSSAYLKRVDAVSPTAMIYVGANDGMLHGFLAKTGEEVFAYVPNEVYSNLSALTSPLYSHKYYVDGSPKVIDAYVSSSWKTVLVSSVGAGGNSVFAIDITDPQSITAGNVMWEFSNADLGLVSQAAVGRLSNGNWVAIVSNGYNSVDGRAKLLIINLSNGQLLKTIDTGVGTVADPNGLGLPLVVDTNNDRIIDFVYAGDQQGNMWKFDLTGSIGEWGIPVKSGNIVKPLFIACDSYNVNGQCLSTNSRQPITARPIAISHPAGGVMLLFGTGSYFLTEDMNALNRKEAVYGVRDNYATTTISKSNLVQQSIILERGVSADNPSFAIRVLSKINIDYSSKSGWFMNLLSPGYSGYSGERVISDLQVNNGRLIYNTIIPSADPCDFGGKSWLMEQNPIYGTRLDTSVFDVNNDSAINDADYVTITENGITVKVPVSGQAFDQLKSKDTIISDTDNLDVERKFSSGSNGEIISVLEKGGGDLLGRQAWRQLQ